MRSNIGFIKQRIATMTEHTGTIVLIEWQEWPADAVRNPVNQSLEPGKSGKGSTPKSLRRRALVHFPEVRANSEVRQFNEIEAGDCIVDFAPDVVLEGPDGKTLPGLQFTFLQEDGRPIDGVVWVPKPVSERLARCWDVVVRGQKLFRPVLLRKKT